MELLGPADLALGKLEPFDPGPVGGYPVFKEEPVVERFVRQPDGTWVLTVVTGLAGEVAFATVPVRVAMALQDQACYRINTVML